MSVKVESLLLRLASYVVIGGISLMLGMVLGENPSSGAVSNPNVAPANAYENPFVEVAEKVRPTVVQVTTTKVVTMRYWDPFEDFFEFESPFEDMFPDLFGRRKERRKRFQEVPRKQQGLGSGFVIDEDGYILTNYHVIENVDEIEVKLSDVEKPYSAEIVGEPDASTDIAVIKINPKNKLKYAELGDSDKIKVGEWVMAVGNPFGLEGTASLGIICAKGRSGFTFPGRPRYQDFIQTDASINLGNSGGPLVNINGEVVGINTFIISPYVGQGWGFAIPINMAKDVYEKIRKDGRVVRGYLGILPQNVDPAMVSVWGLPNAKGVVVSHVDEDTPASKAGLKERDIIIEFDGKEVEEEEEFRRMVADTPVGKKVDIKVIREGKEELLSATIAEMPSEASLAKREETQQDKLGIVVRQVSPEMADRYNLEERKGVIVVEVEPGSPADRKIQPGDIIMMINKSKIENLEDYLSAADKLKKGTDVLLHIRRGEYKVFIVVNL